MVKNGYYGNEGLGLAWDRVKVYHLGLALCLKEVNFECNFDGKKKLRLKGIIEQRKVFVFVVPFLNVYFWLKKGTMGMKVWA